MNERIKALRKETHLTQTEFGAKIGVKGNTITGYETGIRAPSDAVIFSICRTFNVNEQWLRTGEGEMFISLTRDEEIAGFIGSVLSNESDTFQKRLISVLARMSESDWEALEKLLIKFSESTKKD